MNESARPALFLWRDEKINMAFTALGFAALILELTLSASGLAVLYSWDKPLHILYTLIVLEGLHVILGLVALMFIPEFGNWIHDRTGGRSSAFWLKIIAILVGLFGLFFFATNRAYHSSYAPRFFIEIVIVAIAVVSVHHRLSQSYGIGIAYDRVQALSGQPPPIARWRVFEKYAFLVLCVSALAAFALRSMGVRLAISEFVGYELPKKYFMWSFFGFVSIAGAAAVALVIFVAAQWRSSRSSVSALKLAHSARYLFYPIAPITMFGYWVMEGMHSIEYLSVWRRMREGLPSTRKLPRRKIALALLVIGVFYASVFLMQSFAFLKQPGESLFARIVVAFYMAVLFTHYYVDRILFRMRDPATRSFIGALLVPSPQALGSKMISAQTRTPAGSSLVLDPTRECPSASTPRDSRGSARPTPL
jgi:MFS family permease